MMTPEAQTAKYNALAHALQSGVAAMMQHDTSPTMPKHLRVGVNIALVQQGALAKLLIEKGVITADEYRQAINDAMAAEVAKYESDLSARYGTKISLG